MPKWNLIDLGYLPLQRIDEILRMFFRGWALWNADWSKSALHPRLKQPMRIVDIAYFDSEHDDYHLARISELKRNLSSAR